jgi:hypothetical protein
MTGVERRSSEREGTLLVPEGHPRPVPAWCHPLELLFFSSGTAIPDVRLSWGECPVFGLTGDRVPTEAEEAPRR